jgi:sterol desaturase/sphingolipid hydroxylase (fatty acid hydroxylase superfamily)
VRSPFGAIEAEEETPAMLQALTESGTAVATILAALAIVSLIETAIPLHARGHRNRAHLGPNLALTLLTFATSLLFNSAIVIALGWLEARDFGLLLVLALPPLAQVAVVVLVLDFSFYVGHVALHKIPGFWRFHPVHHSDPAVDVTTTLRQHPGEGVIRYAFMATFAFALGASPAAFGVYRVALALNGLLEHANIRLPLWLDGTLSLVTTWPNLHKVHHSRDARLTDTNYDNLFSFWDRLFATFTPSSQGVNIAYGLEGWDDPATQTTAGLLAVPFRGVRQRPAATASRA